MNRSEQLARLEDASESWDLLVIGGGATGLATALDAATRGYRTALVEQADFSEGTSSKSTKLIHGGVRYLRNGEIGMVRESLRERGRLLRNAAGIVEPLAFVVPAYRWYERFFYGTGLFLYDRLAGSLGIGRTGHLSRDEVLAAVPNLSPRGLRGGTLYWDGQFDDAALALAMVRTASDHGAAIVNHAEVTDLVKEQGRIRGARVRDRIGGAEFELRANVVVNATGVFTDLVRRLDDPASETVVRPSQGIHLVLPSEFLGSSSAVMIPKTEDGRVLFAIPWQDRVLLGTTDTEGVPASLHPQPLEEEIDYLIRHAAEFLERAPQRADVRAVFAGLRPLVSPPKSGQQGGTAALSRSHSLFVSASGLVTMTGGKWTTCRQMGEDAVDRAAAVGGWETRPCRTADLTLSGPTSLAASAPALDPDLPFTMDHVDRAVREEMAMTLDDVLSRRIRAAFLDAAACRRCARSVAERMALLSGHDEAWVGDQVRRFEARLPAF